MGGFWRWRGKINYSLDNVKYMFTCNFKDCLGNFFFIKNEFNYRSFEEIV